MKITLEIEGKEPMVFDCDLALIAFVDEEKTSALIAGNASLEKVAMIHNAANETLKETGVKLIEKQIGKEGLRDLRKTMMGPSIMDTIRDAMKRGAKQ